MLRGEPGAPSSPFLSHTLYLPRAALGTTNISSFLLYEYNTLFCFMCWYMNVLSSSMKRHTVWTRYLLKFTPNISVGLDEVNWVTSGVSMGIIKCCMKDLVAWSRFQACKRNYSGCKTWQTTFVCRYKGFYFNLTNTRLKTYIWILCSISVNRPLLNKNILQYIGKYHAAIIMLQYMHRLCMCIYWYWHYIFTCNSLSLYALIYYNISIYYFMYFQYILYWKM